MVKGPFENPFPTEPGVYIMRDAQKKVLYIGKAKNLKVRLRQYEKKQDTRYMIPALLERIHFIETIIVETESEALLLENTLIKKHQPPFNAMLKDDKTFFSIKLNDKHPWPALKLVRLKGKVPKDGKYFGPYTYGASAKNMLETLREVFPLRRCSNRELMNRSRPCLLYQMKKCIAPCVGYCTKEEYKDLVNQVEQFLKGKREKILKELQKDIQIASEEMAFEKAAVLARRLKAIQKLAEKQHVDCLGGDSFDAFGVYKEAETSIVCHIVYHEGRLSGSTRFSFSQVLEEEEEVLERVLIQLYDGKKEAPPEILLPLKMKRKEILESILSNLYGRKISIKEPKKGDRFAAVQLAQKNAASLYTQEEGERSSEKALGRLQEKLNLENYPELIECYDNSHIAGDDFVAAKVVFVKGKKISSLYRQYLLKEAKPGDDYGALKEILERRLERLKTEKTFPDLLLIDGGKGHLNIAKRVLEKKGITGIDLVAVAKENSRHDKGMTQEVLFYEGEKIFLDKDSVELALIQRIRDEAHRFAIKFHRKKRLKHIRESGLEKIPGIGPSKKRALLQYFGSFDAVSKASYEELCQVAGISQKLALVIYNALKA